jgi:hypothetical protein
VTISDQYGFSQNLAMACLLVGVAMLVAMKVQASPSQDLWKYGTTALVAGVLLFYRCRPVICMATRSGMPARTRPRTAVRRRTCRMTVPASERALKQNWSSDRISRPPRRWITASDR